MSGIIIKDIKLLCKTVIIYIIFVFISLLYFGENENMGFYYMFLFFVSVMSFIYCFFLINIDYKTSKVSKRTINKLNRNSFVCSDLYPIYYMTDKKEYADIAEMLLSLVIENQREKFISKGYVVVIGSLNDLYCFSRQKGITGLFNQAQKTILLHTDYETLAGAREKVPMVNFIATFHHEWGHFVDFMNYYISESIPFQREFFKEKRRFRCFTRKLWSKIHAYGFIDSSEYFATKYSLYKTNCYVPKYFKDVFDRLEGVENVNINQEVEL